MSSSFSDLSARAQWHQLAEALLEAATAGAAAGGSAAPESDARALYEAYVRPSEAHLCPLRTVQLAALAARACVRARPYVLGEVDTALELMAVQVARRARAGEERLPDDAYLAAVSEVAALHVWRAVALGAAGGGETALDGVKAELVSARDLLAALPDGCDAAAGAAYWRAAAEYHRVRGPAADFYHAALAWLARTPLEALPEGERGALAVDVALAALVGEGVYNFGEVNAHRVLGALAGGPHAWLAELLRAFQHGDIDAFNAVLGAHGADVAAAPALAASAGALKEKIALLALMELAARRPALGRVLTFADVAAAARLPADQVEWLLMRALALGLIDGDMDEVARTVNVTYVKPRVLDAQQIRALADGVRAWRAKADTMLAFVEAGTAEIFRK